MSRVSKKEDLFYGLLLQLSKKMVEAGQAYVSIIEGFPDSMAHIPEMKTIEHEGDAQVHEILVKLYESFITPFDREDIFLLVQSMDDVIDSMEHIVRRMDLYHVSTMRPDAARLAEITLRSCKEIEVMFEHLPHFKNDPVVQEQVNKVHDLEDDGDDVYHAAVARLFDETDSTPTHLLKWSTIYDRMEDTIDSCKTVSSIVSNVVLKNA